MEFGVCIPLYSRVQIYEHPIALPENIQTHFPHFLASIFPSSTLSSWPFPNFLASFQPRINSKNDQVVFKEQHAFFAVLLILRDFADAVFY